MKYGVIMIEDVSIVGCVRCGVDSGWIDLVGSGWVVKVYGCE